MKDVRGGNLWLFLIVIMARLYGSGMLAPNEMIDPTTNNNNNNNNNKKKKNQNNQRLLPHDIGFFTVITVSPWTIYAFASKSSWWTDVTFS